MLKPIRVLVLLACTFLSLAAAAEGAGGSPYGGLEFGRYPVGFRTILAWDASRSFSIGGEVRPRPVVISLWYPAVARTGKLLRLRDYLAAESQAFRGAGAEDGASDAIAAFAAEPLAQGASRDDVEKLLSLPVMARRDAARAAGAWPAVLYAHTPTISKAIPCEYLASHGFLVISTAVVGTFERDLDVGLSGAETQARDLEFALLQVARRPADHALPTAIAGMSFGGLSAFCYALRHPELKAIVSLDGGAGSASGAATVQQSPYFEIARLTAPLLHLYQPEGADLGWLEALRYERRVLVRFPTLRHADFSGSGLFENAVPSFFGPQTVDRNVARARVWALTLQFLEEHLSGRPPSDSAIPAEVGAARTLDALPAPPRLEDLRSEFRSRGFAGIEAIYRRLAERDPQPFSEETLRKLGGWLLETRKTEEASRLFTLQTEMYPQSARAHYLLANAERRLGRAEAARAHFQKALELLPGDLGLDAPTRRRIESAAREAIEGK